MHGDLLLVALVLVLGCAAFFVGVIYLACSFLAFVGRSVLGLAKPRGAASGRTAHRRSRWTICPRDGCGKVECRAARYCGQCGMRLSNADDERNEAYVRI